MVPRQGLVSQASVSMDLIRADTIPNGSKVWVEDTEQVWILVEVVRQDNTMLTVRRKTGEEVELDLVSICRRRKCK